MNPLVKRINDLEKEVRELKKAFLMLQNDVKNSTILQKDFGKKQIFSREVQFLSRVLDKNGNTVTEINP